MDCQEFQNNKHEVLINTKDIDKAFGEIVLWGESVWWPKNCTMKFIRRGNSSIQRGTIYRQKVLLPFAPSWLAIVTDIIEKKSISRKFLDVLLDGQETISISPCDEKLKIEYLMNYKIKGQLNNILWRLFFNGMHDNNIRLILKNLKEYLEK